MIIGIDPGPKLSAMVSIDRSGKIKEITTDVSKGHRWRNADIKRWFAKNHNKFFSIAIEMINPMGMPVGKSTFDTILFIGQLQQIAHYYGDDCHLIYRRDIKMHICNSMKAKDGNIRQALINRYGEPGTKKNPGKTYGFAKHTWQALAAATVRYDLGGGI